MIAYLLIAFVVGMFVGLILPDLLRLYAAPYVPD